MTAVAPIANEAPRPWHAMDVAGAAATLNSDATRGIASDEAARRQAEHGPNLLPEGRRRSTARMVIGQFTDVMVLVLIAAAVIAGALGEQSDVIAILVLVVMNAVLGFVQEYRAERAMAALRAMAAPAAHVRRGGLLVTVAAADLVPGDLVLLDAGAIVPADLRLTSATSLRVDESALTGESNAVEKITVALADDDAPLGDRLCLVFKGTVVTYGRGEGLVIATGPHTELGRIARLLRDVDESATPLQARLGQFGRVLAVAVLALCAAMFVAGLLRGEKPVLILLTSISLAVAAVPEALPALVTVALALGARKMVKQHALIRRLPAVETLGSVTFICSDKTGTLTENRMEVDAVRAECPDVLYDALALNNDAAVNADGDAIGDPTESACYRAAARAGHPRDALERTHPRVAEVPFSSARARMTTVHRTANGFVAYTKGAPERVLPSCIERLGPAGTTMPLDGARALAEAEAMAASGLRVLAVATRRMATVPASMDESESAQTFVGLVGLLDPPRAEARDSVALCQSAGIHVMLITGDHPATARAIAERLGIAHSASEVLTGRDLAAVSPAELQSRAHEVRVYARVAPEDKIRIVQALQARGEIVAMTGDGVNDAPALRRANIGIAMGRGGTDVAREAAHMVLLDDNFATIVNAVREGRRIYDNIRRFVRYILATNSGELWTLFVAPFLGLPLPLLPIQILWMNLVTDGLPGLATVAEPAAPDLMQRKPRPPDESILADGLWQHALWVGLYMAVITLGMQAWSISIGDAHWRSMVFTTLTLAQLAHLLAIRSERESVFRIGFFGNRPLLAAVAGTVVIQLATLYVPLLQRALGTRPLTVAELAICLAVASSVFFAVELEKLLLRRGLLHHGPVTKSR